VHLFLLALLARAADDPAPGGVALDPADALAEGAALKLGIAARQLAATGAGIARAGRIGQLPLLRADADAVLERSERLLEILGEQEVAGKVTPRPPGAEAPLYRASAPTLPPAAPLPAPMPTEPEAPKGPPPNASGPVSSGGAGAASGAPGGAAAYPPPAGP
jgi:hypothetical protein